MTDGRCNLRGTGAHWVAQKNSTTGSPTPGIGRVLPVFKGFNRKRGNTSPTAAGRGGNGAAAAVMGMVIVSVARLTPNRTTAPGVVRYTDARNAGGSSSVDPSTRALFGL